MTQRIRVLGFALLFAVGELVAADVLTATTRLSNQPPFSASNTALRVLNGLEQLAYSNDWRTRTQTTVPRGGHALVILDANTKSCNDLNASVSGVTFYSFYPTYLPTPSSQGGQSGWYYEVLVPRNSHNCHLSPFILAEWRPEGAGSAWFQLGANRVEVAVTFEDHFVAPRRPFHIGLSNSYLIQGHCLDYCPLEVELGNAYRKMLIAHHLSPYHHWIRIPPIVDGRLDLDAGADKGLSFRQQVMSEGATQVAFPRARGHHRPIEYLRALEQTLLDEKLVGKAWIYVRDEPQDLNALEAELALYRTYAPSVMTLVTTPMRTSLASGIDIFAPLIHHLEQDAADTYRRKRLWPYTSCMRSCGPNRQHQRIQQRTSRQTTQDAVVRHPGPDPGLPDLLIDRPADAIDRYFDHLDHAGADATLYYHAVEGYPLFRRGVMLRDDPWNFGGNGDGLLLFPGRTGELGLSHHQPLPSFRLKLLRQAIERRW